MNVYKKMAEVALINFQKETTFNCAFHEKEFMEKLFYRRDNLLKLIEFIYRSCERINIESYEMSVKNGEYIYHFKNIPVENYNKFIKECLAYIFNINTWNTQSDYYSTLDLAYHLFQIKNYDLTKEIDRFENHFDFNEDYMFSEVKQSFCKTYAKENKIFLWIFQDMKSFKEGQSISDSCLDFEEYLGLIELNYSY